jgi:hypothetical protein
MRILLLDIDGVLADFNQSANDFHKFNIDRSKMTWSFWKQFNMTDGDFWSPLDENFWANLPPTKELSEIISLVERFFGEYVYLCSSPCLTPGCATGKARWVEKHLPKYSRKLLLVSDKHLFAKYGRVLIDDNEDNCRKWRDFGIACTVPRPWNSLKYKEPDLIGHLTRFLEEIS